jgi:hypothetical protein
MTSDWNMVPKGETCHTFLGIAEEPEKDTFQQ